MSGYNRGGSAYGDYGRYEPPTRRGVSPPRGGYRGGYPEERVIFASPVGFRGRGRSRSPPAYRVYSPPRDRSPPRRDWYEPSFEGRPPAGYAPRDYYDDYEMGRGRIDPYYPSERDRRGPRGPLFPERGGKGGKAGRGGKGGKGGKGKKGMVHARKNLTPQPNKPSKQYKTFVRMHSTMRVGLRLLEHLLQGTERAEFVESLSEWEKEMNEDMKKLDPTDTSIDVKFVNKEDSEVFFEKAEAILRTGVDLVKAHPNFKESDESLKFEAQFGEKLDQTEKRHACVVMAAFMTFVVAALSIQGATRTEQLSFTLKQLDVGLENDPELLKELDAHSAQRLENWLKFSRGSDTATRVNCLPGSGGQHPKMSDKN